MTIWWAALALLGFVGFWWLALALTAFAEMLGAIMDASTKDD